MTIVELIDKATAKDRKFRRQMFHKIHRKNKVPDLKWLMSELERILGEEYVQEAARQYVNSNN